MAHLSPVLQLMINTAREAAKKMRRDFYHIETVGIGRKGAADFVTEADILAENTIFELLSKGRPKYGFMMEERGNVEGKDNSNRWIIDPIDGTTNFMHGLPDFAISICLERDRVPYAGVIYSPIKDLMYYAEKGSGAYCNDRRIRVSERNDLSTCLVGCGFPFKGKAGLELSLNEAGRVLQQTAGVRRFGSAAMDMCMVASGQLDGFWERDLQPWDCAAGVVIVQEAGGVVKTIDGEDRPHLSKSILASNGEIFNDLQQILDQ